MTDAKTCTVLRGSWGLSVLCQSHLIRRKIYSLKKIKRLAFEIVEQVQLKKKSELQNFQHRLAIIWFRISHKRCFSLQTFPLFPQEFNVFRVVKISLEIECTVFDFWSISLGLHTSLISKRDLGQNFKAGVIKQISKFRSEFKC